MDLTTNHYSKLKKQYNYSEQIKVEIKENLFAIPLNDVFLLAERQNKKRKFLFVSPLLGKHLAIKPQVLFTVGQALAYHLNFAIVSKKNIEEEKRLKELFNKESFSEINSSEIVNKYEGDSLLFLGFAETATALGQVVYQCFNNTNYVHTTREIIKDKEPIFTFEEEHSHAVDQLCYFDQIYVNNKKTIVLVDDEITTGKTALNIIESIQKKFPRKRYIVLSILNWLSEKDQEKIDNLKKELDIEIVFLSLIKGNIVNENTVLIEEKKSYKLKENDNNENSHFFYYSLYEQFTKKSDFIYKGKSSKHLSITGRFGIESIQNEDIFNYAKEISQYLSGKVSPVKTLCIGTGEFMYLPLLVSKYLKIDCRFQATTKSPIIPRENKNYPIKNRNEFNNPEVLNEINYLYNLKNIDEKQVIVFVEKKLNDIDLLELSSVLKTINFSEIHFVSFM
ncbi:phosphoribosyltransferase family protein [Exiguobacterium artemiae]|uniref:phosphoribosyltransferase family protein n=1 Tax=Exiguobacterium artemiae TaxID=340145 RepID=UPI0006865AC3|nr:phosphoribosyltransferase family protein [Exiguobacterium sibiricum]